MRGPSYDFTPKGFSRFVLNNYGGPDEITPISMEFSHNSISDAYVYFSNQGTNIAMVSYEYTMDDYERTHVICYNMTQYDLKYLAILECDYLNETTLKEEHFTYHLQVHIPANPPSSMAIRDFYIELPFNKKIEFQGTPLSQ